MQVPPADWGTGRTAGPLSCLAELRRATLRHRPMRMPRRSVAILAVLALAAVVAACGASAGTPVPTASIIQSAADAARAVANDVPLFAGIGPRDANLIGQSSWYEATPTEAAKPPVPWSVIFRIGWGDCPAGLHRRAHLDLFGRGRRLRHLHQGSWFRRATGGVRDPTCIEHLHRRDRSGHGRPDLPRRAPGRYRVPTSARRRRRPGRNRRRRRRARSGHHRREWPVRSRAPARRLHPPAAAGRGPDGHCGPDAVHRHRRRWRRSSTSPTTRASAEKPRGPELWPCHVTAASTDLSGRCAVGHGQVDVDLPFPGTTDVAARSWQRWARTSKSGGAEPSTSAARRVSRCARVTQPDRQP